MFFYASKVLGFFAIPSNFIILTGIVGALLLRTRFSRAGWWLATGTLLALAVLGLSPAGNLLILPLEQRFPPWDQRRGAPDGIMVLGGAVSPEVSATRGTAALNEAAERVTAAIELARRYPEARMIYSGGSGLLSASPGATEATAATHLFESLGFAPGRLTAEDKSRNTVENALFSKQLAQPKPGERWLLVTSGYHMPRAIGIFRKVGFPVEAYPVDWRTRGPVDVLQGFPTAAEGLRRSDIAIREWVGLLMYRLAGYTSEFFPGPLQTGGCDRIGAEACRPSGVTP